jgi:hypothetical protein
MGAPPRPAPADGATAGPRAIARLGPFAVGQSLTDAWAIDALELSGDGIIARTSGTHGRVAFEMTCASSPRPSPVDIGGAHVFYSSDLAPAEFESASLALQQRLREAGGANLCTALAQWRAAAQADPAAHGP